MVDSYRPQKRHPVRDTAEQLRSYDRRHREQSSPQRGYHPLARDRSRSLSARPWYGASYYRPSPERRPQERRITTTVTITTITTNSTSTLATQPAHTVDERRYESRRTTTYGREHEWERPLSPRNNGSRREGPRRRRSRSRSPLRARETYRRPEGTPRRFQSRSPGRSRDSRLATGSHYQESLANPARMIKTSDIGSGRRNGLRNGEIQPQNDKECQWVKHQLRLQDLVAGRGEPRNSREADHVRLFRKQAVVQSRSPGRSRDSNQAAGSQDQASVADPPARRVKTAWIDKRRRKGLRNSEIQPQNDKERRWVEQQLRYLDLDAGRVEPADAIEADIVRQHRKAGYLKATKEDEFIDESAQAIKLERPVT